MDLGAAPWKKNDRGKGKDKSKGTSKGYKGQGQDGNKQKGQCSNPNTPNPSKDKEFWCCNKKGRVEAERRKKQADAKAKPKAKAGIEASETEVLSDTRAGSHLFRKGFDSGLGPASNQRLKSQLETSAGTSALSAGQAAATGTWTVIGPGAHCMALDKHARKLRQALNETKNTMQLVLAATRAAKKTMPAEVLAKESEESGGGDPAQGSSAGGPAQSSVRGPVQGSSVGGRASSGDR